MTPAQVKSRVRAINKMRGDDEAAHGAEDHLHRDVLRAIAHGAADAPALAREALRTDDIEFARWCA